MLPVAMRVARLLCSVEAGKIASLWNPRVVHRAFVDVNPKLSGKIAVRQCQSGRTSKHLLQRVGGGTGPAITDQISSDNSSFAKDFLSLEADHRCWCSYLDKTWIRPNHKDAYKTQQYEALCHTSTMRSPMTVTRVCRLTCVRKPRPNYPDVWNIMSSKVCSES